MRSVLLLLRDLEDRFPPGPQQHHALTLDGDHHLMVTLMLGTRCCSYTLDPEDLERTVFEIADDVARLHRERMS